VRAALHVTAVSLALSAPCATACYVFAAPEPVGFEMSSGGPSVPDAGASPADDIDTDTALAPIVDGGFRSAAFTHATLTPYPSVGAPGSFVDEWVSSGSYALYSEVQPDAGGSGVQMPPGSMIVRAVVDSNDDVAKLTVMLKGPAGYNPALGDWWFAETDPSGVPLTDDAGVIAGRLSGCYPCHVPRSGDDYLFGVPLDDRPASN
jgi:hypothetical protein